MHSNKTTRKRGFRLSILAAVILVAVIAVGGWLLRPQAQHSETAQNREHPEYLSFPGNYVFSVPKSFLVDDRVVPDTQLVYSGQLTAKTLEEAYNANAIAIQPISGLSDKDGGTFKKYVNGSFVADLKKNVSPDVQVEFAKYDGWDVARITATKDNKPLRFAYLKNGQHPVAIVSKEETDAFKKIEQTITDVETSDLKDDVQSAKQTLKDIAKLIKDQKGAELHKQAAPDFKSKNNEADILKVLQAAAPYTKGAIKVSGAGYTINPSELAVVLNFEPISKDAPSTVGALIIDKIDGQWKLRDFKLPSQDSAAKPAAPASTVSPKKAL